MRSIHDVMAVPLAAAVLAAACSGEARGSARERDAAGPPPATLVATKAAPSTSTARPAEGPVLGSQEFNGDPDLRCDVLEVRRVSGGALLLKWRLLHVPAASGAPLVSEKPKTIYHNWSWDGVYVTEPVENKKYMGLRDSSGAWIAQGRDQWYAPGDRQGMWMKFPAPPEGANRITFVFPGFGPFEDLPVAP